MEVATGSSVATIEGNLKADVWVSENPPNKWAQSEIFEKHIKQSWG